VKRKKEEKNVGTSDNSTIFIKKERFIATVTPSKSRFTLWILLYEDNKVRLSDSYYRKAPLAARIDFFSSPFQS